MRTMRRSLLAATLLSGLLVGCGSQTKTVTVTGPPATTSSAASTAPSGAGSTGTTSTAPPSTPASTSTTRTAPEPAFTEQESHPEGVSQAVALLQSLGYTARNPAEYHADQTLRVLVGTRSGAQQAFFFLQGRYLGTDTKDPSAQLKVVSQSDTEVAISYSLYRAGEPAGQQVVRFALNDGKLSALDPIPPASSSTGPARD